MVKLGIVILNYKTYWETEKLVNKLLSMSFADMDVFIEIVDNDSPNESFDYLHDLYHNYSNIEISETGENGGFSKGNNFGLRKLERINPDYVLILNNDVLFEENILTHCVEMFPKLKNPGIISPVQCRADGTVAPFAKLDCYTFAHDVFLSFRILNKIFSRRHKYISNTEYKNVQSVEIIPGCFLFTDYKLFKRLGFFDEESFLFGEEYFLYKKTSAAGLINYILLDCSYIHNHSTTIGSEIALRERRRLLHEWRIPFTRKYRSHPEIKVRILRCVFRLCEMESRVIDLFCRKQ